MRRRFSFGLFLAFLLASPVWPQNALPKSLPHWKSVTEKSAAPGVKNKSQASAQMMAALKEYGETIAEIRSYSNGSETFHATLYTFADASGAYGAYSYLRTPDMARDRLSLHSSISRERALVLTGDSVLEITGNDLPRFRAEIKALASATATHSQATVYPALPLHLPTEGLLPRSDHYFLGPVALGRFWPASGAQGDWLGFSMGAEAEVAAYRLKGREASLLLVDYPTPQIAETQFAKFSKELKVHDLNAPENTGVQRNEIYARRDGSLVALLKGAPSLQSASALLDQVHTDLVLTWNVPASRMREPPMTTMIVGSIIGAAQICGFTLFGGFLFAGFRILVKKLWPGKIFDRPSAMDVIQLGLSSKPINSKDFY